MLLSLTTTLYPATDLGYLLHKNPARVHETELAFGSATVFYPEATEEHCTAVLLLDVDPVALSRRVKPVAAPGAPLEPYVNDRPYVASSFLSVAIARVYGTALGGRSRERPELAASAIPLVARLPVVPVRGAGRGDEDVLRRLFSPLGYRVETERLPLDPHHPEWGDSPYESLTLASTCRLSDLLRHLYVLLPVLDDRKHYWVGEDEVDKLLHRGGEWLAGHPERELIVQRYLKRQRPLARLAFDRLAEAEDDEDDTEGAEPAADSASGRRGGPPGSEVRLEAPLRLNDRRLAAVADELEALGAASVVDLGCGEGKLLERLLASGRFVRLTGVDASLRALQTARRRLRLDEAGPALRHRLELLHGALTYRDARLEGFDAAVLMEVIEHLDPTRLGALERVVFAHIRPSAVVVTTPNREYNARFPTLPPGELRHADHRFEWTRAELREWADGVALRHGYTVRWQAIGDADPQLGPPTQMVIFAAAAR